MKFGLWRMHSAFRFPHFSSKIFHIYEGAFWIRARAVLSSNTRPREVYLMGTGIHTSRVTKFEEV